MRGVFLDGPALLKNNEHRWPVMSGTETVGAMTSAVHSPRLDRNIGFALMNAGKADAAAARLTVQTPEGMRQLEFTDMPFIDPKKRIPRARLR